MRLGKIVLALSVVCALGCSKDDTPAATTNTDYANMNKGQTATQATATNSNGLALGSGLTLSSLSTNDRVNSLVAFDADSECATSGWPAMGTNGDVGYAMKFLLCSVLKRPDGPDTVRGGFDRITGMLCAIGPVTYDGTARNVTATFSTDCFSQTFVTTACTYLGAASATGPCTATVSVTGHDSVTGVAPADFEKYVTIEMSGVLAYTVAFKASGTTLAGALMGGLPSTADGDIEDAFAFYLDSATGILRYEGRFAGTNLRHMRINMVGTISSDFQVSNVETLNFVQGENFGSNNGLTVSVSGTPSAGRVIRIQSSADLNNAMPMWAAANADDNTCIGEAGVMCTGNSGIVATDNLFFFQAGSGFTSSKTWFTNNSYLGGVSATVDMDDIWD